jgi:hypothetical protein
MRLDAGMTHHRPSWHQGVAGSLLVRESLTLLDRYFAMSLCSYLRPSQPFSPLLVRRRATASI